MHVIVALSPICTVVFFGRRFCRMGRDFGLAVEEGIDTVSDRIRKKHARKQPKESLSGYKNSDHLPGGRYKTQVTGHCFTSTETTQTMTCDLCFVPAASLARRYARRASTWCVPSQQGAMSAHVHNPQTRFNK